MKRYLLFSIAFGALWCGVHGIVDLSNFLFGMFLGFFVIVALKSLYNFDEEISFISVLARIPSKIKFGMVLVIEILKANIILAKIVLSPKLNIKPGTIEYPLDVKSDTGITVIANTISLTPGTITLDVSEDRSMLYIHTINVEDPDEMRENIKNKLEKYVVEAFE
ncbi:multisubunit sodium/proton antiporter, MrpE subunit (2.A.63.1) [Methanosalsum zhilinae DSM 4017]|uniref:Multisubunit sodium/proton antiporter, MrpE subunit (2.A.63.1) n=1 Tax=Methanosalsum zhilinae (strain DSM 4017 / NBRC 107636 / OCM 62 / WeN5) TaxID=679901 RepID=F7XLW4_METZD|nr:Na+/H+ antiporter subunit E [Methanosalsum zhilinae]AEH60892.1 multisubunit sodium/proton antiporter, MrpE subunit (2.A.63.1) [Methanosalsum zhilinae DSM 4017]